MNKNKSKFKKRIRISKNNLAWIGKNKTTKTMAGFLDIIINFYKLYGNVTMPEVSREQLELSSVRRMGQGDL